MYADQRGMTLERVFTEGYQQQEPGHELGLLGFPGWAWSTRVAFGASLSGSAAPGGISDIQMTLVNPRSLLLFASLLLLT